MNGTWFPWSIGRLGNTAETFVTAWQHVVSVVRGEGATNVRFVWAPYSPCDGCPTYASLYPGDSYVDYAGFSTFDWGADHSLRYLVKSAVRQIGPVTTRPMIIAETGTPAGTNKADWIRDGYRAVYAEFPQILAIVYFDVEVYGQPDWRLDRPGGALDAYRALYDDPRFTSQLDTSAPTDGQVTIASGRASVNTRAVTLTLGASDDIGVTAMRLSEDTKFKGASWRPYTTSADFVLSSGDGDKTVYARFRDLTGNVSPRVSDSIVLDRVPPDLSLLQLNGGALDSTSRTVVVHLEASDAGSGVSGYRLADDGGAWSSWVAWPDSQASVDANWNLSAGDALKTVHAQVRDRAHNTSASDSAAIQLDSRLNASTPTVDIDGGAEFTDTPVAVLDLAAPAGTTQIRVSNHSTFEGATWEPYAAHRAWVLDDPGGPVGTAVVHVSFRSEASGEGTSASDDIVIDHQAPNAATQADPVLAGGADSAVSRTVTLDTRATDHAGGSGVGWMQLSTRSSFTGAVWESYRETRVLHDVALAKTSVFVRFRDGAGNVSATSIWTLADPPTPSAPTQVAPFDVTNATSRRPTFRWLPLRGASRYQIQVDDSPAFTSPSLSQSTTATKLRPSTPLPKGKDLYWRVRQTHGNWSAVWRFRVPAADAPQLR